MPAPDRLQFLFRAMWWSFAALMAATIALGVTVRLTARPVLDALNRSGASNVESAARLTDLLGSPGVLAAGLVFLIAILAFTASFFGLVVLAIARIGSAKP